MKTAIQPQLTTTTVTCSSCGTTWATRSARPIATVEVCAACHPAYTGDERRGGGGDRVERFERRRRLAKASH